MTTFVGFPQGGHSFSADEVGMALSGLVVRESTGLPRVGVLGRGPVITAVAASWKVQVSPFVYAHQVSGAVQFSGVSTAEQLDILPAAGNIPVGQKRIDLVVWNPVTAALSVVTGTPAVSPVAPSHGATALLAQLLVEATDGMVLSERLQVAFQYADKVFGAITTVAPGVVVGASTRLQRDAAGMVDAYVDLNSASALSTNQWLATLPAGFRPVNLQEFAGAHSNGGSAAPVFTHLLPTGSVVVWNPTPGNRRLTFSLRYQAVV